MWTYREGLGIPAGTKILALSLLWIVIGVPAFMAVEGWAERAVLP